MSSHIKTQKGEKAVESVQNSEVQEDAGQLKKAVGDRVEFTSKLKKGCRVHIKTQDCVESHQNSTTKLPGPVKCELKKV